MDKKNITTGNVGEWSELYVLVYVLAHQGMFAADSNQDKKKQIFYKVLRVIFQDKEQTLSYTNDTEKIDVHINNELIASIPRVEIKELLSDMFSSLQESNDGRAFAMEIGNKTMEVLMKESIKAPSFEKKDIELILSDIKTGLPTPETGFSIKSQLGSPSTLINASKATNFTFEILDSNNEIPKNLPILHPKNVKDNIQLLRDHDLHLKLHNVDSPTFRRNIERIDSNMSDYIGSILQSYYSKEATTMSKLLQCNFPEDSNANFKMREFLSTMALGMMPNKEWDGIATSLGGFVLVKRDGDVLCYYLYNITEFREYLVNATKLETPSTTRYGIGSVYEEHGRFFIKLNLQVRFLK